MYGGALLYNFSDADFAKADAAMAAFQARKQEERAPAVG